MSEEKLDLPPEMEQPKEKVELPADLETQAMAYLQKGLPEFCRLIDKFQGSRRSLKAVMMALAQTPFNERPFDLRYNDQKQLFEIGQVIQNCKLILMHSGMKEHERNKTEGEKNGTKQN